ncbi:MAG: patatin-like phospholipase family protein [Alphaproteobacteria bacterium]|nr:patatin-like phospholipase family protein [Alphaproteobacteria bacterium]
MVIASAASTVVQAFSQIGRVFSTTEGMDTAALFERVRGFDLFGECDEPCLQRLIGEATWFGLPGGMQLDRDGENDQAVFLVLSGRLRVSVADDKGALHVVAHVPAGETVGEMSLLAGDAHSAILTAARDTELLRLSKASFLRVTAREPRVMTNLTRLIIKRLRATTARAASLMRPKTFALVPLDPGIDAIAFGATLRETLGRMGLAVAVFDQRHREEPTENQYHAETRNDLVIYVGDEAGSAWSQHCIRQADRVMLLTRAGAAAHGRAFEQVAAAGRRYELVVLHGAANENGAMRNASEDRHNIRLARHADVARLARLMTGRAVGLVLAGGGARGFAHIGAVRALREAGVTFDMVGGSSMGAVIAAGVAMEWDDRELLERMHGVFVKARPLRDYTLPLIALLRGGRVQTQLKSHFGEICIEDMALPFFAMTSDLTDGHAKVQRSGPVWRALKASVSIPGLLPPVVIDGHLHVDGGIMNNLPVDVMAAEARGPIVAIDVVGDAGLRVSDENYGDESWLSSIRRMRRGAPGLTSILMRAGTVGNEYHRRMARAQADLVIDPDLPGIGLTHWKKFDSAVAAGYRAVKETLERQGLPATLQAAA